MANVTIRFFPSQSVVFPAPHRAGHVASANPLPILLSTLCSLEGSQGNKASHSLHAWPPLSPGRTPSPLPVGSALSFRDTFVCSSTWGRSASPRSMASLMNLPASGIGSSLCASTHHFQEFKGVGEWTRLLLGLQPAFLLAGGLQKSAHDARTVQIEFTSPIKMKW